MLRRNCKIPLIYCSQLMAVAYAANTKEAWTDGNIIRAAKLKELASK